MDQRNLKFDTLEDRILLAAHCPQFPNYDHISVPASESTELDVLADDGVPGAKIVAIGNHLEHGDLVLANNSKSVTYTPDDGYVGLDYFTYLAKKGNCEYVGVVRIDVIGPPVEVTMQIHDASKSTRPYVEGDSGTSTFVFDVFRSTAIGTASVSYSTADGTAIAGSDYEATSGVLEWGPGEYFQRVYVEVYGDLDVEADETFFVNLSTPTNATIIDGQGLGTIINDDAAAIDAVFAISS